MSQEFKPKFLSKEEREKLKAVKIQGCKTAIKAIRSRSPRDKAQTDEKGDPELEIIKSRFLGIKKTSHNMQKPSDKFRQVFKFEWDPSEDTSITDIPRIRFGIKSKSKQIGFDEENKDESKHYSLMTDRDWKIFRENNEIYVKGSDLPPPIRSWNESTLSSQLLNTIKRAGYKTPTPIQMQAIPYGLQMRDLIGLAPTGSGKSAAYLIPMINTLMTLPKLEDERILDGPYGVILSPTRELAQQINNECQKLSKYTELRSYTLLGGKDIEFQSMELTRGYEIIIATPGRFLECLERQYIVLNQCLWIVIDEADKMVLLELNETLDKIFSHIPTELWKSDIKGTTYKLVFHLFSATMDADIENMWQKYLRDPGYVSIKEPGTGSAKITQKLIFINENEKRRELRKILNETKPPIIVFVNHKKEADELCKYLSHFGWRVGSLHGGKSQDQRESIMENFKTHKFQILVTTNLASRGIDVKDLQHVINYDCPDTITDYEHRIGRTGRINNTGLATSFITSKDDDMLAPLKTFLSKNNQKIPDELANHPRLRSGDDIILL